MYISFCSSLCTEHRWEGVPSYNGHMIPRLIFCVFFTVNRFCDNTFLPESECEKERERERESDVVYVQMCIWALVLVYVCDRKRRGKETERVRV